jgi:hypothetical protein
MSHIAVRSESSASGALIKSELNNLWSELQTNLPTIDFDEFDTRDNELDETPTDVNDKFSFDDINDDEKDDLSSKAWFDNSSLRSITPDSEMNDSYPDKTKSYYKSQVESVNTKLNMQLFDLIDIDEIVDSIPSKGTSDGFFDRLQNLPKCTQNSRIIENDKRVLEKLKSMSLELDNPLPKQSSNILKTDLSKFETLGAKLTMIDDILQKSSKSYIQKKDGNSVETRKLDLRPEAQNKLNNVDDKINAFLSGKLIQNEEYEDTESSDSETDDEDDRGLWIERFRKQKLNNPN